MVGIHHAVKKSCMVGVYHGSPKLMVDAHRTQVKMWWTSTVLPLVNSHLVDFYAARWMSTMNCAVGVYPWVHGRHLPDSPIFCKEGVYHELSGRRLPSNSW